ncbi:MAG: CamS family sex pheromone protein [Mycoplasmatales bacterium]
MKKILILIIAFSFVLSGCDHAPRTEKTDSKIPDTKIIEGESGDYKTVIPQPVSPIRGVSNSNTNTNLDLDSMEQGLSELSKKYVSPNDFLYQPGQVISSDEGVSLLDRRYTDLQMQSVLLQKPTAQNIGLNPVLEDGADPAGAKIYVQSIVEQNYFKFDESGNKVVDTISIGFSFDPTYTYSNNGVEETILIEDSELNEFANSFVANQMTAFLRSKPGYENVNIVYGFFKASDSELYPGTYISKGYTKSDNDILEQKEILNTKYVLYPSIDGDEIDPTLNNEIAVLVSTINKYFPYTTGMYAIGLYKDDKLEELKYQVNVNTYSTIDIIPFVNYINEQINLTISPKVKTVVEIKKPTGEAQAVLEIDSSGKVNKYIY